MAPASGTWIWKFMPRPNDVGGSQAEIREGPFRTVIQDRETEQSNVEIQAFGEVGHLQLGNKRNGSG